MWQKKAFIISILALSLLGCKTQEEIAREKLVDTLSVQMVQNQKLNADTLIKIQDLEDKLLQVGGQVEDSNHSQTQSFQQQNQTDRKSVV